MANPTVRVGFLGDASQLAREARRAQESLDGVSRHAHTTSTALGTALGTVAGRGIGAIAGAAKHAVGSVGELASASIEAAGAMEESLHKNDRVFGSSAGVVTAWAADTSKNILLTKQAAIEGAGGIGNLLTSWGVAQPEAAKLSTSLTGLAQDLSSFAHISQDDAFTALRSGLAGQARGLRQYGVDLSATRVQAEAYALGLAKPVKNANAIQAANVAVAAATAHLSDVQAKHGKGTLAAAVAQTQLTAANDRLKKALAGQTTQLTAAQTVQARYALIMKGTRTIQGDAARESGTYANQTRILHKNISDLEVTIGQKLLPYALQLTHTVSDLVVGFDQGTGAGGRLREDLGNMAEDARNLANDFKPVLGVTRWFVEHPSVFRGAAEGLAAYWVAAKAAALWNARFAATAVVAAPEVAAEALATGAAATAAADLAIAAPGAAAGIEAIGGAATLAMPEVALLAATLYAAYKTWQNIKAAIDESKHEAPGLGMVAQQELNSDPYWYLNHSGTAPAAPDDHGQHRGASPYAQNGMPAPTDDHGKHRGALAPDSKTMTDKAMAAQKYQADQADAAAKRNAAAADALNAATQKIRDALQMRTDMARGIRDSLVSSNSIIREGVSFTAHDLLVRFNVTVAKVKRFQTAISALVHKGFSQEIVQQAAQAGIGSLGAVEGLAHASLAQVRAINSAQASIDRAAGGTGERVAGQLGPITFTSNLVVNDRVLATTVNRWNAQHGNNGHLLAS